MNFEIQFLRTLFKKKVFKIIRFLKYKKSLLYGKFT